MGAKPGISKEETKRYKEVAKAKITIPRSRNLVQRCMKQWKEYKASSIRDLGYHVRSSFYI